MKRYKFQLYVSDNKKLPDLAIRQLFTTTV